MGPAGMSSRPGSEPSRWPSSELLTPSPSSQPQGFTKMDSHSLPHCLPLCRLPWAASEQLIKGTCLRPTQSPGIPVPSAVIQMPQVSHENLALTHLPTLPPGRHPVCTMARLFHQDPFAQRSPHRCPPLHDQKLSTPKLEEFPSFFSD